MAQTIDVNSHVGSTQHADVGEPNVPSLQSTFNSEWSTCSDDKKLPQYMPSAEALMEHNREGFESRCQDPKSLSDYWRVMLTVGGLPAVVALDILKNTCSGSQKRRSIRNTALDSVMGHCYRSFTLRQLRIVTGVRSLKQELSGLYYKCNGSTRKLKKYNHDFKAENHDFVARWVHEVPDRQPEDPVILYFHGGGYALKTCQPQIGYMCDLARLFRKQRVSVLVLDYAIAPFARFPTQRNQALACLAALQKSCSKVVLFGDSCGGNLALSVLQEEEGPLTVDNSRMFGCILVSPWVNPACQAPSMNSKRDILSKRRLDEMTASFVPTEELNNPLVAPLHADASVWKRVLPKNTCMTWGDFECLADQDAEFQKKARVESYFIEKNGSHDCILRGLSPEPCRFITQQLGSWIKQISDGN